MGFDFVLVLGHLFANSNVSGVIPINESIEDYKKRRLEEVNKDNGQPAQLRFEWRRVPYENYGKNLKQIVINVAHFISQDKGVELWIEELVSEQGFRLDYILGVTTADGYDWHILIVSFEEKNATDDGSVYV